MKVTIDLDSSYLSAFIASYLGTGLPSALLTRVLSGIEGWETTTSQPAEDVTFAAAVRVSLDRFRGLVRKAEDQYYAQGASVADKKKALDLIYNAWP